MLIIRLRRFGRTHEPTYRIVLAEKTSPVQGKFIVQLGHYNPKTKALALNKDEAMEWLKKGAKPSNTVAKLMKKEKMVHASIVIHQSRRISAKELAAQKAAEEAAKAKEQAAKEAAKEAWEQEAETKAEANEPSNEKLIEQAEQATGTEAQANTDQTQPENEASTKENAA